MFNDPTIVLQAAALIASIATAIASMVAWRFFNIKLDEARTNSFREGVYNAVRWLIAKYGSAEAAVRNVDEGVAYVKDGKPQAFAYFEAKKNNPAAFAYSRIESHLKEMIAQENKE